MSKSGWFRFYHDLFTERKFRRLTRDQKLLVIAAWCIASRSPVRGLLLVGQDQPAVVGDLADEAMLSEEEVARMVGTPEAPGALCPHWFAWEDGALVVHDWDDWQYQHPSDAPEATRERKQRQREKAKGTAQTPDVTSLSRANHETDSDSDADADSDSKSPLTPSVRGTSKTDHAEEFAEWWGAYPHPPRDEKGRALRNYGALRNKGTTHERLLISARNYAASRRGEDQKYHRKAANFLGRDGVWAEWEEPAAIVPEDFQPAAERRGAYSEFDH